jgi:hypothetical protein
LQGASAIQQTLEAVPSPLVRIFVIWEPVLPSDLWAPKNSTLSLIPDRRAMQFWDRGHLLSKKIVEAARSNPAAILGERRLKGSIIWDFVGLYPRGVRWDAAFPTAKFAGSPVLDVIDELRIHLAEAQAAERRSAQPSARRELDFFPQVLPIRHLVYPELGIENTRQLL